MVVAVGEDPQNQSLIVLKKGNMMDQPVQAIVNAANPQLEDGGGVTGVIWKSLGAGWQEFVNKNTYELRFNIVNPLKIPKPDTTDVLPTGRAATTFLRNASITLDRIKHTQYYTTNCKPFYVTKTDGTRNDSIIAVIHAVGPLGSNPKRVELINTAYTNSLIEAQSAQLTSIAFPLISAGIYGYKTADSAKEVLEALLSFYLDRDPTPLNTIYLMFFNDETGREGLQHYLQVIRQFGREYILYDKESPKKDLVRFDADCTQLASRIR